MKLRQIMEITKTIYKRLLESYGPQFWWPAETAFEIMVGAVLTQNTSWNNAKKAIISLKTANVLNIKTMSDLGDFSTLTDAHFIHAKCKWRNALKNIVFACT